MKFIMGIVDTIDSPPLVTVGVVAVAYSDVLGGLLGALPGGAVGLLCNIKSTAPCMNPAIVRSANGLYLAATLVGNGHAGDYKRAARMNLCLLSNVSLVQAILLQLAFDGVVPFESVLAAEAELSSAPDATMLRR